MKVFKGFLAILLLVSAGAASAAQSYTCNGCSYSQAQSIAWQQPVGANSYVADFTSVQLYLFTKRYDREARRYVVEQLPVPKAEWEFFLDVAEYRVMYPGNATFEREVTDNSGRSAYDLLQNPGAMDTVRTGVATYFHSRGDERVNRFMEIMNAIAYGTVENTPWVGQEIQLLVTVKFADGTTAKFLVNKDNITQAKYIEGSARDLMGNVIPDGSHLQNNGNGLVGLEFHFDPDFGVSLQDWIDQLRLLGIPFTGPNGSGGERIVTTCTVNSSGGMTCTGRIVGG